MGKVGIDEAVGVRRGQIRKRIACHFKEGEIYPGSDGDPQKCSELQCIVVRFEPGDSVDV